MCRPPPLNSESYISAYTHIMKTEKVFRALSDRTRLHLMLLLLGEDRLCVCELVHALDASQSRISRHLGQLRDLGMVLDERRGQWVYYRLHPALPEWVQRVLDTAAEAESLQPIQTRLAGMPNRPLAGCD